MCKYYIITGTCDYHPGEYSVTIPPNRTKFNFDVNIIDDDLFEEDEKFKLVIARSEPSHIVFFHRRSPYVTTVHIKDDEECE